METGKALEIVHGMAVRRLESPSRWGQQYEPAGSVAEAQDALNTVQDFIVNNFAEDDEDRHEKDAIRCGEKPFCRHDHADEVSKVF